MAEEGEGVGDQIPALGDSMGEAVGILLRETRPDQTRPDKGQDSETTTGSQSISGEAAGPGKKEVWRHGIRKSANVCKCIGREYLVLAPRGESHGHPSCTQPISCTGSACTRSPITFCPGSCICYNAKDPSALANRRLEPAIGCCGGALSRHPGAASDFTAPKRRHGLPWPSRGVAPKGLEASPPAALGRCSLPPETCVAMGEANRIQDGDSLGL
ncbi:hypothetical protein GGI42DRAFT_103234 [Trichoderma sp. SZMC 28013]